MCVIIIIVYVPTCAMLYVLCSMSGGELFDRIQKKGHFTERGAFYTILYILMCVCEA